MKQSLITAAVLLMAAIAHCQSITPAEAAKHIGEKKTVCGKVFGARYLENADKQPTLLNMGDAYPKNPFTFVIFGEDRKKFSYKPEEYLVDKEVCITGYIKEYKGKPEIIVTDTEQVLIKKQ